MIDIESEVFSIVAKAIREEYPDSFVSGENTKAPAVFPAIIIEEVSNETFRGSLDTKYEENHSVVMYEVNVYSNKKSGKKTECKRISKLVDKEFEKLGFLRVLYSPVPNLMDSTIYRIILRFRAIVAKDKTIFRR